MATQIFHDWGTTFDTDNLEDERLHWGDFCDALRAGRKGRIVRLRYLADYVQGWTVFDLSYCYVQLDGKIYDVMNFPVYNGQTKSIKRDLYEVVCKDPDTPFIRDLFTNLSIMY